MESYIAMTAWKPLYKALEEENMRSLFFDIEMPLVFVLYEMQAEGIRVDSAALKEYGTMLGEKIAVLEQEIYADAGETFNINSPKQLGVILFEKMGMPNGKKTKSGYSTAADILENTGLPSDDKVEIHLCRRAGWLHSGGWQNPRHV